MPRPARNPRNPFALLAAYGRDLTGALEILDPQREPHDPAAVTLSDDAIGDRLRNLQRRRFDMAGEGWSLAGAQGQTRREPCSRWLGGPIPGRRINPHLKPGIPQYPSRHSTSTRA